MLKILTRYCAKHRANVFALLVATGRYPPSETFMATDDRGSATVPSLTIADVHIELCPFCDSGLVQMYTIALLSAQRTARAAMDNARRSTLDGWSRVGHPGCTAKLGFNLQNSRASRMTKREAFQIPGFPPRRRTPILYLPDAGLVGEFNPDPSRRSA